MSRHTYRILCRPLGLLVALFFATSCGTRTVTEDPTALLEEGWRSFRLADYKKALRAFDDVIANPGVPAEQRWKALHGKASVWDLRQPVPSQDDELAKKIYQQIIDEAPQSDIAAWSLLALARMIHLVPVGEDPDYPRVREAYQVVIDAHPDHLAGQEALIYQQSTLIMTLDPADTSNAIARLHQFLNEYPQTPFASAANDLLAQGYETLGNHEQQLEARLRELAALEIDPNSPASADLSWRYWQLATTAEFLVGRFDIARTYYQKLIDEYPLDFRKFPSRQALARMDRVEQSIREEIAP